MDNEKLCPGSQADVKWVVCIAKIIMIIFLAKTEINI